MAIAYYNENDEQKAAWLRELIKANLIAPGDVDERSIEDVIPNELAGYTQCHFFAGIGIWSYALRCAGWPDDRPVWTGSCPCQPFSAAGQRKGFADERHLWPAWYHLISIRKPDVVFGEQTAKKDGFAWLDLVQDDLEAAAYAVGAVCIPAGGFGAPHIRERIYFVADTMRTGRTKRRSIPGDGPPTGGREFGELADTDRSGSLSGPLEEIHRQTQSERPRNGKPERPRNASRVADSELSERRAQAEGRQDVINGTDAGRQEAPGGSGFHRALGVALGHTSGEGLEIGPLPDGRLGVVRLKGATLTETGSVNGFWRDAEAVLCNDEDGWKFRPVEPGSFPLAHGAAARILRLRGYGDGICAPVAEEFIRAYMAERGLQC
jgi:DNA (cytosine-5)-methyltransferase 1